MKKHPMNKKAPKMGRTSLMLGLALLAVGCHAASSDSAELSVQAWLNTDGPPPTLSQIEGPLVVEFWATWCPPCEKATPHLVELSERYEDEGLSIVGIHHPRGIERGEVERFIERYGIAYPIGLDVDGSLTDAYGIEGIPHAFVYDRGRELVWSGHPLDPMFDEVVRRVVDER